MTSSEIFARVIFVSAYVIVFFSGAAIAQKPVVEWIEADIEIIKFRTPKDLKLIPFKSYVRNPWEFRSKKSRST